MQLLEQVHMEHFVIARHEAATIRRNNERSAGRGHPGSQITLSTGTGASRWWLATPLAATLIFLGGCNPAPKYVRPPALVPSLYKEASPQLYKEGAGWTVAQPSDDKIRDKWWEIYGDPELDALEEQVAGANQNVIAAAAAFQQARAQIRSARASLYPTVSTSPSYLRSKEVLANIPSNLLPGHSSGPLAFTYSEYDAPVDVSYELDLWHRVRNTVAENVSNAQASAAELATALLSNQAELAQDYFELRSYDARRTILADTVAADEDALKLTRTLFRTGLESDEDVTQAQTQLATAKAQETDLGVSRAQYEHAIAVLIGKPPADFSLPVAAFAPKPPSVPVGLPSELLERRPDIAEAERKVATANAAIGVAKAAYYPSLSLSASGGFLGTTLSNWFDWSNNIWSLGPQLAETVFDGGVRKAAVEEARDSYDQTVANYRQTVLSDFQAVEDNLAALRILSEEEEQETEAVILSGHYLDLSLTRYKNGVDSYLNVVSAQTTLLNNRNTEAQLQARQMIASVSLVLALGGGWDVSQLPSGSKLTAKTSIKTTRALPTNDTSLPPAAPNPPPLPPANPGGPGSDR